MLFKETDFEKAKREKESKFKLKIFHWNPNDKRVFVPDRFNLGLGEINFAHPRVWRFLLIIAMIILLGVIIEQYLI